MKLRFTRAALADLDRIRGFYSTFDPDLGLRLAVQLRAELQLLRRYPRLGQPVQGSSPTVEMRRLIVGACEIRYTIAGDEVRILRLWHGAKIAEKPAGQPPSKTVDRSSRSRT